MKTARTHRHRAAAAVVLIALLAPLAPLLAWNCSDDMASEHDCADHAPARCAGLWSAACCDFASPPRPTDGVPGDFDAHSTAAIVGIDHSMALFADAHRAPLAIDLLLEDRAGPPPPRLLTSVLLI